MRIVIAGLSVTSSWGNGHATTFRGLMRGLSERGHDVLFLERDVPWYASNRDLRHPPYGRAELYSNLEELKDRFAPEVRGADVVMVGSYVPEGVAVGEWVVNTARGLTCFYDIDTPITMAKLEAGDDEYISRALVARYHLYLSFTGGPMLERIRAQFGALDAQPLYCSVDPSIYFTERRRLQWDLGYLGTYSADRQPVLKRLLLHPARQWKQGRFVVAGPLYPEHIAWPQNVDRIEHLAPADHRAFYNAQRFSLNVTRREMARAGYSPSVRLFEAAACGCAIVSDSWEGLEIFFEIGREILIAATARESLRYVQEMPEEQRITLGHRARARVLAQHTSAHRAAELEKYLRTGLDRLRRSRTQIYDQVFVSAPWDDGPDRPHGLGMDSGSTP